MTGHPPEPPAGRPPPSPRDRRGRRAPRPGTAGEWPGGPHQRYPGDQPGHGHRATAASYPANGAPPPADRPLEPGYQPGAGPGGHLASTSPVEFPADGGWALAAAPVSHEEYVHPGRGPAAGPDASGARWAMLGYLTVPLAGFVVPLAVYLTSVRRSRWLRAHAAQAVNVWLTGILYGVSAAIIGAMLVLDSPRVALAVVVPLVAALWLTMLAFLVRAAAAARRGQAYTFPRWLCSRMVR